MRCQISSQMWSEGLARTKDTALLSLLVFPWFCIRISCTLSIVCTDNIYPWPSSLGRVITILQVHEAQACKAQSQSQTLGRVNIGKERERDLVDA